MSGFQIPGLGFAKPNETLPPLPADLAVAAAHSAQDAPATGESATAQPATENAVKGDDKDDLMKDVPSKDEQAHDEPMDDSSVPNTAQTISEPVETAPVESNPTEAQPADPMAVDREASPPNLTDALEAAINGLDSTNSQTSQAQPTIQAQAQDPASELQNDQGEHPEWEVDSSPYESSSESSSSDSSDEDSDNEGYELLGVEETARLLMEAEGGSDDEGDKGKGSGIGNVRTKNELPEEVIPKPDVTITPEMKIEELGAVEHVVDTIIVIKAITTGEYQVLDTGSVLCTAERVVIGAVAETIGKVLQPMYTVYFSSAEEAKGLGLEVGSKVFYPVDHASYVFTEPLKGLKGSDASNLHDEEIGDEEMEFSDDEKELEYKRSLKKKKQEKRAGARGGGQPHPLRQEVRPDGGLNYDEEDDGPYKPLTRPSNYGEGPVTTETYEPPSRSNNQRGRRGDSRGRGGRGRGSGRGGRGGYGQPRDGYSLPPGSQGQQNPMPQGSWGAPTQGQAPSPAAQNFNFQFPGWPAQPGQGAHVPPPPPPPPPGWNGNAQGQAASSGAFVNPAFFAALMGQMQQQTQQGGQPQWPGQQPPHGGRGQ